MKNIVLGLLAASLLTGGLSGCNSKLDVPPVSSIDAGTALTTSTDVQAALIGCYASLQSSLGAAQGYSGYIQMTSDLLADNGDEQFVGTFSDPQQAQRKNLLITNGTVSGVWISGYDLINRTNNVLANLDKLDTPAKKASGEGEARFLRALMYFDLVRLYAKAWNDGTPSANPGVPLVLTPTTTVTEASKVSRNTVAEVYTQVISDLTAAEAALPVSNGVYATRGAAAGLLARVYLQQGDFANAAAAANRVIASGRYTLNTNYADNFVSTTTTLANSAEDVFAVQFSSQSGTNQLNVFYSVTRRADVNVLPQFVQRFETGDTRRNLLTTNSTATYTSKYDVLYGNIKLMRLAEMYLTRAEANFRAGTTVGAAPLADINTIRTRAKLPALTALTLPAILKERRLELAFEGFRLGDLKRNQESAFDPLANATFAWNSPKLVFPIPLREINANPNLTQNAGY